VTGSVKGGGGPLTRVALIAVLVGVASVGVQVLFPLVFPKLDRTIGLAMLLLCVASSGIALFLHLAGRRSAAGGPKRRWAVVGVGQGWVETHVRDNAAGSDQIHIIIAFCSRSSLRQSDHVELIFEIDDAVFEWDVPDGGHASFELRGEVWRDVEAIKAMLQNMRHGKMLKVLIPKLQLAADFTLDGAFDALCDVASLSASEP
jgi:hypothetical protein